MEFPKVEYLEMLVGLILIAVVFGATYLKEIKDQTKAIRALLTTLTDHARDSRDTLWDQLSRGGMRAGEWNYTNLQQKRHPAEKPIELLLALVQETTAPIVIDPFMGSGTTLAACVRLGRPCIGIERDPTYFAVACDRLQHEVEAARQRTFLPHVQAPTQAAEAAD